MAKKVQAMVKLQIPAGKATPAPPVGTALGLPGRGAGPEHSGSGRVRTAAAFEPRYLCLASSGRFSSLSSRRLISPRWAGERRLSLLA